MVGGEGTLPPSKKLKSGRGLIVGFPVLFYSETFCKSYSTVKYGLSYWCLALPVPPAPVCAMVVAAFKSPVFIGLGCPAQCPSILPDDKMDGWHYTRWHY